MLTVFSDIIVIGGGAAGMMAAFGAGSQIAGSGMEAQVTILEKMPRPGRKIMITGKGRCNFTNVKNWEDFSRHIRTKASFLKPSFYNLGPEKLIEFLNGNGLETVVERGDRAFPESHKSMDVIDTLVRAAKKAGVTFAVCCEVTSIAVAGDERERFSITLRDGRHYSCSRLIIATGGLSYPATGSTGDGYGWAERFGHKIKPCFPSLTAIVPKDYKDTADKGHIDRSTPLSETGKELCGISLKNVGLTLFAGGNEVQSETGDLDFTDGGIEGPIGFEVSRNAVKSIINGSKVYVELDLKPAVSEGELSGRVKGLWNDIQKDPRSKKLSIKEMLKVLLGKLLPWELVPAFTRCNPGILNGKRGNERIDMTALVQALKGWRFEISGYVGYERAVVTAGGVDTEEIVAKTMESKLVKGLYFCGEVLDMDCDTGGYNLQSAFSSGLLAGQSAAKSL